MYDRILYVEGVPRWFTRLAHIIAVRRCRKIGHVGALDERVPSWLLFTCTHCGLIAQEPDRRPGIT